MPQVSPTKSFDYSSLDAEISQFVQQQTGEIRMLMKRTAQGIVEIGQKLIEVKTKLGHGRFLNWLDAEFEWSEPTAQRFMRVAQKFKFVNLKDLQLAPSALYLLAAPSTPEAVREEALERASAGESITYTTAKEIKQKYTPPSTKPKPEPEPEAGTKLVSQPETPSVEAQLRHRATAPPRQSPEILAIRPDKAVSETTARASQLTEAPPPSPTPEQLVQLGSWWQLEQKHLLYCGTPTSPRFQERLPKGVALSLAFPPSHSDWPHSVAPKIHSALSLFTIYQDQDLALLREAIERLLLLYTEGEEVVVFSFLPDPELLLLAHKLGCRCFVAEPDAAQCDAALATWKQTGAKFQKLSGLRF